MAVTAVELLRYNLDQLVVYLEQHDNDISNNAHILGLVDVQGLSTSQYEDLTENILNARYQIRNRLDIDGLIQRLEAAAATREAHPEYGLKLPVEELVFPLQSDDPGIPGAPEIRETASYYELIRDGGRPACAIEDMPGLVAASRDSCEAVLLPWLTEFKGHVQRRSELRTISSRQLEEWWRFRKLQLVNRGVGDREEEFSFFFEAEKRIREQMGCCSTVANPLFKEWTRDSWKRNPPRRQLPDGQDFPAYHKMIKKYLAPFEFKRTLQLRRDPRRQTKWTSWLEYVGCEQWYLEEWSAFSDSLGDDYCQDRAALLEALEYPADQDMEFFGRGLWSDRMRRRLRDGTETRDAQAILDDTNKAIGNFLWETREYSKWKGEVCRRRRRVEWAVKEARLMEREWDDAARRKGWGGKGKRKCKRKRGEGADEGAGDDGREKRSREEEGDGGGGDYTRSGGDGDLGGVGGNEVLLSAPERQSSASLSAAG